MTRKANPFTLRCNPLRVTTTMTFRVRGAFIFSTSFRKGVDFSASILGVEVGFSAGGGILIASILGGELLGFSAAAALPGAQVGHTLASLSLKQIPAQSLICPDGHPAYFSDWVRASWLCGDRSLALFYGITNSHIVSSLTTRTGAIREGDGECLLYGYRRNTNE